jgi:pilus assembly protein CpaF
MGLKNRIATAVTDEQEVGRNGDVQFYRKRLLEEIDLSEMASLSLTQRRARLERVVGHLVSREGPVLSNRDRAALIRRVVDEALGLGVLEPLLADEDVTEIMVNGAGDVFIERAGRIERVDTRFTSEDQLYQTIDRIVSAVNRRVDESSPMVDARLPGGERVNVIIPPLSLSGPVVTIRRFPRPYRLEELVAKGSLDPVMAAFLAGCIRARLNVLISGGTGSGKTTMLNSLSAFVPPGERIITIEDSAELSLQQQHVIRLESRPANVEGHGEITIRDLVRNSLRMRPDRIIVGEVRGGETMDMLQAMNTGHEGSLCTVHANSSDDAILRLETLASMSELNIPSDSLRDQINGAIDVIIHLARTADGARRMVEICTLASRRRETFRLATIVNFEQEPLGPDRVVRGRFRYYPVPRPLAERLVIAGEQVPPQLGVASGPSFTPEREAV